MLSLSRSARRLAPLAGLLALACSAPAVRWTGDRAVKDGDSTVTLTTRGDVTSDRLRALATTLTLPGAVCAGSVRLARAGGSLFAVWWSPRPDSLVWLRSAHSPDDGRSWSAAVPVDTTDRGATGCRHDPAAIAADSATGYVHVTYGLDAAEGPGLFFSHSMDGGASFHTPVPILYGEHPGRTSVASSGDLVVVGFEDPNSATPRIGLALSRTMGHIFEERLLPVSDDNGAASRPLVALRDHVVFVAWQQHDPATGGVMRRVRSGMLP